MLTENLIMLRNIHRYSQEQVAEKIGISRQAYAKWESGATVPDIEKCRSLADLYGVTIDSLINGEENEVTGTYMPAPKGKNIWGTVIINERGQIVIPKAVRDRFGLNGGQRIVVLSDETGIALVKAESFEKHVKEILESAGRLTE